MSTFLFDKIIFGPVDSRRLGKSLGINLLSNTCKVCSFNCIYCECGWTSGEKKTSNIFPPREIVNQLLNERLAEIRDKETKVDAITFAGNGEPTLHPEFRGIINDVIRSRNFFCKQAKIVVLSNASMVQKKLVFESLQLVDINMLKLDGGNEKIIRAINQPLGHFNLDQLLNNLEKFNRNLVIQTLFLRGEVHGEIVDNTTGKELEDWLRAIKKVNPSKVVVYSLARNTPARGLEKIKREELESIARLLEKEGIRAEVS